MGVLPLQFIHEGWQRMGLTGEEIVSIRDLEDVAPRKQLMVGQGLPAPPMARSRASRSGAASIPRPSSSTSTTAACLNFVLRNLAKVH